MNATPTFDLIVDAAVGQQEGYAKAGEELCADCAARITVEKLPPEVLRIALAEIVANFVGFEAPEDGD